MAGIVLDANAVGQVITYVAPGYLAYLGYRLRYPGADRPAGEVLIVSVVISLPLVALISAVLPGTQKPSQLGYVALLLAVGLALGYLAAIARGRPKGKEMLGRLGYRIQPESSIYAQTLYKMSEEMGVLVELKDGRRMTGCPRLGPQYKDDGINALYLVYPEAVDDDGESVPINGAGVIVPLAEVSNIVLSEDPTRAPQAGPATAVTAGTVGGPSALPPGP